MTTIDWDALMKEASTAAAAIPPGDYDMVITDAQVTTAQSSGRTMIKATLRVESGPHQGRVISNNFVIVADNPNALRMFFRNMNSLGLDANFFAGKPQPE